MTIGLVIKEGLARWEPRYSGLIHVIGALPQAPSGDNSLNRALSSLLVHQREMILMSPEPSKRPFRKGMHCPADCQIAPRLRHTNYLYGPCSMRVVSRVKEAEDLAKESGLYSFGRLAIVVQRCIKG